jgi:hypothetical protein
MRSEPRLFFSSGFAVSSTVAIVLALLLPGVCFGALSDPPEFSITPTVIRQGDCYTISVPNWRATVLNIAYSTSTTEQIIYGWPSLGHFGDAYICTDAATPIDTYTFNLVSNTVYYEWWPVDVRLTVGPTGPVTQPTSLSFNPTSGYAGNDCYTMTIGNGANLIVDFNYFINYSSPSVWTAPMNGLGQWQYCLNHHDQTGTYFFNKIKNHLASDWVSLNPAATYWVKPPQPTSAQIFPSVVAQGMTYRLLGANAAAVTLDIQYTINDGPVQTIIGWPSLIPVDGDYGATGSPNGYVDIGTSISTEPGKYTFTSIRNTLNTDWVPTAAIVAVCPNLAPTISSVVPNAVPQGGSIAVTFRGTNLCAVGLQSVTNSGLSFSNVAWAYPLTSVTATANAIPDAAVGSAQIRLATPGGAVTTQFGVSPAGALTREYIYLGNRVISIVSP